jgi:RNA polymerase sigma factor (sigma-70 family)
VPPTLRWLVGGPRNQVTPYQLHKGYVLGVLARRCSWLDGEDREVAFHDAYEVLLEKERGGGLELDRMHERQVRAYLTQTAINKALNEGQRGERRLTVPLAEDAISQPDSGESPEEHALANADKARVHEIVAQLSPRQQAVVKLRFFLDRSPEETQRFLGLTARAYRKELERAVRRMGEQLLLVRRGRWCQTRRSLIFAYVAGVAGPNRGDQARLHLRSCSACARLAAARLERSIPDRE